jgi:hypothetical protein
MPSIAGFWSYAHADDDHDEGRIVQLARRLQAEYELLTAEELELFIDESTLMWGDDWRERIAAALERVTFFIPVITPTYFRRAECRKELMRFAQEAKERQAEKLILPIYYVEVPELESDKTPADEVMAAVKPFQREDLRRLRLKDQNGAEYRDLVSALAHRLISIAREAEESDGTPQIEEPEGTSKPLDLKSTAPSSDHHVPEDSGVDEHQSFFLEEMAKGEEALGGLRPLLEAMSKDIEVLGSLSEEATQEMHVADEAGKPGFASRLAVASRLASRLEAPARSMERHAQEYVSRLWDVDPFVNQLLNWALKRENDNDEEVKGKEEFLKSVFELAGATSSASASTSELLQSVEENANLRNILDAQALIAQWAKRAETHSGI